MSLSSRYGHTCLLDLRICRLENSDKFKQCYATTNIRYMVDFHSCPFSFDHPTYLLFPWPPIPSSPSCQTPSFLNFSLPESTSCWICHQIREFQSGFPDKLPISAKTLKFVNILPKTNNIVSWQQAHNFPASRNISPIPHSSIGSDHCSYHYVHTEEGIHERGMK